MIKSIKKLIQKKAIEIHQSGKSGGFTYKDAFREVKAITGKRPTKAETDEFTFTLVFLKISAN